MQLPVELSVLYNDPSRGGYICRGARSPLMETLEGEGFVVSYDENGSGRAILCRRRITGGRATQLNLSLSWKTPLPLGCLSELYRQIQLMDENSLSVGVLDLPETVTELHDTDACLLHGILLAVEEKSCFVIDRQLDGIAEQTLFNVLSRLPLQPISFSLAIGLPVGAEPCHLTYLTTPGDLPATTRRCFTLSAPELRLGLAAPDNDALATLSHSIAVAPQCVAELALRSRDLRYYLLYSLPDGIRTDRIPDDEQRINDLISCLDSSTRSRRLSAALNRLLDQKNNTAGNAQTAARRAPAARRGNESRGGDRERTPIAPAAAADSRNKSGRSPRRSLRRLTVIAVCLLLTIAVLLATSEIRACTIVLFTRVTAATILLPLLAFVWGIALGCLCRR